MLSEEQLAVIACRKAARLSQIYTIFIESVSKPTLE